MKNIIITEGQYLMLLKENELSDEDKLINLLASGDISNVGLAGTMIKSGIGDKNILLDKIRDRRSKVHPKLTPEMVNVDNYYTRIIRKPHHANNPPSKETVEAFDEILDVMAPVWNLRFHKQLVDKILADYAK